MKKLAFLSAGILALALQSVSAQYNTNLLFTTSGDFASWQTVWENPSGGDWGFNGIAASTAWDYDGSSVNGLANGSPGSAGTAGSLRVDASVNNWSIAMTYMNGYVDAMHALDPGCLAAYSVESGGGKGTLVAYTGILQLIYTVPVGEGVSFTPELYWANTVSGWNTVAATSVTDLGDATCVDLTWGLPQRQYMATYSYTVGASTANEYFNLGFIYNTSTPTTSPWYIDQVQVLTPVPEPGTMALAGLGALGFAFLARRRRA